jgi:hypothetical protein
MGGGHGSPAVSGQPVRWMRLTLSRLIRLVADNLLLRAAHNLNLPR